MAKRKQMLPRLSAGELEMIQLLWEHKTLTLAEAQEAIGREIGYTTIQTRLNRLVEKGLVERSEERPARYRTHLSPDDVSQPHLDLLLKRVSGGSVVPLVAGLIRHQKLAPDEIAALRKLVDDLERGGAK